MKKLYAKTSFANKKTSKQTKTANGDIVESEPNERHSSSPIMAYRQSSHNGSGCGSTETATVNKTPKMARANNTKLLDDSESLEYAAANEPSHYYYSIGDIDQALNWQQLQRMRQQEWRRRRLTNTPVLTTPLRPPFHQTKQVALTPTSPIYELPRIMPPFQQNDFASLPPELNGDCVASAEEAVNTLWQGNANNKHDKCVSTTKTMLQHSQSMPMTRSKPASNQQHYINFYAEPLATQITLPVQRHNSFKENHINRPTTYVYL